ncbi:hypothetical protein ACFL2K_00025 [Candidatus Margulisiibacteriota bacterium]
MNKCSVEKAWIQILNYVSKNNPNKFRLHISKENDIREFRNKIRNNVLMLYGYKGKIYKQNEHYYNILIHKPYIS